MNRGLIAAALLALAGPAHAYPTCPDDGRLKGVRIGSALYKSTVQALPGHACITAGPNGEFLVTVDGVRRCGPYDCGAPQ
jgi:hypothetical protein